MGCFCERGAVEGAAAPPEERVGTYHTARYFIGGSAYDTYFSSPSPELVRIVRPSPVAAAAQAPARAISPWVVIGPLLLVAGLLYFVSQRKGG